MADKTELYDKLVDKLLCAFFREDSSLNVALNVNIKECGRSSEGCSRAVVFLCSGEISHVEVLYGVVSVLGRL